MLGASQPTAPAAAPAAVRWWNPALPLVIVTGLLCLGVANIVALANFHELEDGVLWALREDGVVASEIAPGSTAAATGIKRGDVLLAIDDQPVQQVGDVVQALHAATDGTALRYTILRIGTREVVDVRLAPIPNNRGTVYLDRKSVV